MDNEETLAERLLAKLRSGEITQDEYDELFAKFQQLGLLQSSKNDKYNKQNVSRRGSSQLQGGKINGKVNISGRTSVDNFLECQGLSISGSATIDGDLTVLGKTSISGELTVEGQARFQDKIALSGSLNISENMYSLHTASLAGKTTIAGDCLTNGKTLISGKFRANNLKSTGFVQANAKIKLDGDLIAEIFEAESGDYTIGGDLKAKQVKIFSKFRSPNPPQMDGQEDNEDSILGLVSNVVNIVFPTLVNSVSTIFDYNPTQLKIEGNVEGDLVDLSSSRIKGDVIGDHVLIGPNVIVEGKIRYRNTLELPPNSNYTVEKID